MIIKMITYRLTYRESKNLARGLKLALDWETLVCCFFLLSASGFAFSGFSVTFVPLENPRVATSCKFFKVCSFELEKESRKHNTKIIYKFRNMSVEHEI